MVIKGSGFFKVANRLSCGGESWHLRLRMVDPPPPLNEAPAATTKPLDDRRDGGWPEAQQRSPTAAAATTTSGARRRREERCIARRGSSSSSGRGRGSGGASRFSSSNRRVPPDVLVPCRYEDPTTLTALLPSLPLRGGYLVLDKRRAKRSPLSSALQGKWPAPGRPWLASASRCAWRSTR